MVKKAGVVGTKEKADKVKGTGDTLHGSSQKTGRRNRRYLQNSEHHSLPRFPQSSTLGKNLAPVASFRRESTSPPYWSTSMEFPADVQDGGLPSQEDLDGAMRKVISHQVRIFWELFGGGCRWRDGEFCLFRVAWPSKFCTGTIWDSTCAALSCQGEIQIQ